MNRRSPLKAHLVGLLALLGLALTGCSSPPKSAAPSGPMRVLILGDSISIGYTNHVRQQLGEEAVVIRPLNKSGKGAENCAGTNKGIENIDRWLELEGGAWDVIHFNFGLHDLKHVQPDTGKNSSDPEHPHQASPERYRKQLQQIVSALQATDARLIFATTTPVPAGVRPYRDPADVLLYNDIAKELMADADITINDLYTYCLPRLAEIQKPRDVHFSKAGSVALAQQVVLAIRP